MTEAEETQTLAINSRTAVRINAGILVSVLGVAVLAAFAWRDIELTVENMSGDLREVVSVVKEQTKTLQQHNTTLARSGAVIDDLRSTVQDLRERLRKVEQSK